MTQKTAQNIRLVGLDLDNTTLNSKKEITPRVRDAIQNAIAAGIDVLPATGRIVEGIPEAFTSIPGVRYALSSNGAKVYDLAADTVLYEDCFSPAEALDLLRACHAFDASRAAYIDGKAYNDPVDFERFSALMSPATLTYSRACRIIVEDLEAFVLENGRPVEKAVLLFSDMAARNRAREVLSKDGRYAVTSSLECNLEINTATANKGAALLALGAHLGLGRSQVMAMGDGDNDLEMLRAVGHSVAMGNAVPQALAAADEVTATADEDGVALVLERLIETAQKENNA